MEEEVNIEMISSLNHAIQAMRTDILGLQLKLETTTEYLNYMSECVRSLMDEDLHFATYCEYVDEKDEDFLNAMIQHELDKND